MKNSWQMEPTKTIRREHDRYTVYPADRPGVPASFSLNHFHRALMHALNCDGLEWNNKMNGPQLLERYRAEHRLKVKAQLLGWRIEE